MSFRVLSASACSVLAFTATSALASQMPLWSDLRDIAQYRGDASPDAQIIVADIQQEAQKYIPEGTQDTQITGTIAAQEDPTTTGGLTTYGDVTAMMQSKSKGDFIRRYQISLATDSSNNRHVQDVKFTDLPLSETHFQIDAGLVAHLAAVEDPEHHIMMVYPIGNGGFDLGVDNHGKKSIMTPEFENATLHRSTVIAARRDPDYYRGEPFMPITNAHGTRTSIAFHITILYGSAWAQHGPNYLVRSFDSHGCMRMREKDLKELFTIVEKGGSDVLPVNVGYFVYNRGADGKREEANGLLPTVGAYPLFTQYYQRVQNFAKAGETPEARRDAKEHLLITEKVYQSPDSSIEQLSDFTPDKMKELAAYDQMLKEADFGPLEIVKPKVVKLASAAKAEEKGLKIRERQREVHWTSR